MERSDSRDSGSSLDSGTSEASLQTIEHTDASSTGSAEEDLVQRLDLSCDLQARDQDGSDDDDGLEVIQEEKTRYERVGVGVGVRGVETVLQTPSRLVASPLSHFWDLEHEGYGNDCLFDDSPSSTACSTPHHDDPPLRPGRRTTPGQWTSKDRCRTKEPVNALEAHVAALSFSNSGLLGEVHRRDATILALRRVIEGNEESMRHASIWKSLASQGESEVHRLRLENAELRRLYLDEVQRREKREDDLLTLQTLLSRSKLVKVSPKSSRSSESWGDRAGAQTTSSLSDDVADSASEDTDCLATTLAASPTVVVDYSNKLLPESTWGGRGGSPFADGEYMPYDGTPSPGGGGQESEGETLDESEGETPDESEEG